MALQYSPKIETDGLILNLDAQENKSYPSVTLPVTDGLMMWMDAADDSTFTYSSGTTVSQWRDKSPNAYHMTPKSAGPTRNAFLNSRKVLAFTTSQTIGNNTINLFAVPSTVFVVSRYNNMAGSKNRVLTCNLDSGGSNWLLGHWGGYVNQYYSEGWVRYQGDAADAVWRVYMGDYSGPPTVYSDLANLYSNGTAVTTNSNNASAGPNKLGINYYSGEPSDCEVAEIVVFNRQLTTRERNLVHTYLGQKWGISNSDRQIFDLSGNNFNFAFNGTNPRYNNKSFVSNFNTTYPYAVGSFNGQNLTSTIQGLLYTDHTIEAAVNPKGFLRVSDLTGSLPYEGAQGVVLWQGNHGGLYFDGYTLFYLLWNGYSSTPNLSYNALSLKDKIIYITATRQGNVLNLYVNGSLVAGPYDMGTITSIPYTQVNLGCAYQGSPANNAFIWAGQHEFYLVRMYTRQLSATEVSSNYQAFKSRFATNTCKYGLILDIDLSNPFSYAGSGTTVYDASSTALPWTGSNVTYNSDPINYFSYNGSNSWLQSSTSTAYDSQTITMECWCYPNTLSQEGFLFEKGQVNTQYSMFFESITNPNFVFRTMGSVSNQNLTFNVNTYLTVSAWNHIVCTYNGSSKIAYVNGVQVASAAASGTLPTGQINQYIGRHSGGYFFNGRIAESRVYNIALSAAQVLQNYNATKGKYGL